MTTLWLDGFDTYGNLDFDAYGFGNYDVTQNASSRNTHPRTSNAAYFMGNGTSSYIGKNIGANDRVIVGVGMRPEVSGITRFGTIVICDSYTGNNPTLGGGPDIGGSGYKICRNAANGLTLYSFDDTGLETEEWNSPGGEILTGSYTYVEVRFSNLADGNEIEIRLNGNTTPLITFPITYIPQFSWVFLGKGNINEEFNMDDFYISNDLFLGALRCYTQFVDTDIAPQDWALSSGVDAYALLDADLPDAANYIQADDVGDISAFGIAPVTALAGTPHAIRLIAAQNIVDAGAGETQQTVTINAVPFVGDAHTLSTDIVYQNDVFDLAGTGITIANINSLEMQVEKTI